MRHLNDVFSILAEAVVVTKAITRQTNSSRDVNNDLMASRSFSELARDITALRSSVGPRYERTVLDNLDAPTEAMEIATRRAQETLGPLPEITDKRIGMASLNIPEWTSAEGRGRNEMPSISPGVAEGIRRKVSSLLEDYVDTFGKGGFVRLLRQAAVVAHWSAERNLERSVNTSSAEENALKRIADKKDTYGRAPSISVEERIESHLWFQERSRVSGKTKASMAASLRALLCLVTAELRPDLVERQMAFEIDENSGAVIGRFADQRSDDCVIAIYDNAGESGYPNAVLVMSLDADDVANGIPRIEDVREPKFSAGSNYRSFNDALSSMGNSFDQGFFAKGSRFVVTNLADAPHPRQPKVAGFRP